MFLTFRLDFEQVAVRSRDSRKLPAPQRPELRARDPSPPQLARDDDRALGLEVSLHTRHSAD
jgi:hypothetical protein